MRERERRRESDPDLDNLVITRDTPHISFAFIISSPFGINFNCRVAKRASLGKLYPRLALNTGYNLPGHKATLHVATLLTQHRANPSLWGPLNPLQTRWFTKSEWKWKIKTVSVGLRELNRKNYEFSLAMPSELEPLVVDDKHSHTHIYKDEFNTEYKKKFRPFSQYEYSDGRFTKRGAYEENGHLGQTSLPVNSDKNDSWYGEVVELRKKAGEYKV